MRCVYASAQTCAFEDVVRLDNVAQPLLEGAIAAIGIRMELLHQSLVLSLDGRSVGRLVETKDVERAAHGAGMARTLGLDRRAPLPPLGEILTPQDAQRVRIGPFPGGCRGTIAFGLGGIHPHGPGRAMTD